MGHGQGRQIQRHALRETGDADAGAIGVNNAQSRELDPRPLGPRRRGLVIAGVACWSASAAMVVGGAGLTAAAVWHSRAAAFAARAEEAKGRGELMPLLDFLVRNSIENPAIPISTDEVLKVLGTTADSAAGIQDSPRGRSLGLSPSGAAPTR